MAGDWIKLEHWTPDKPEVFRMADILDIDPDAVCGKLARIWIWADQQTVDGVTQVKRECNAVSVTKKMIDRLASVARFADALIQVGWLEETADGVRFVNFDRHNGETAKKRAQNNKRVKKHRESVTQVKRECNAPSVTSALPEKRREEIDNTASAVLSSDQPKKPTTFRKPTVEEIADYCRERGNAVDPQRFFDHYESNGWRVGKAPMKNWQASVRTWEKNTDGTTHGRNAAPGATGEAGRIQRSLAALAEFVDDGDTGPMFNQPAGIRRVDGSPRSIEAVGRDDAAPG